VNILILCNYDYAGVWWNMTKWVNAYTPHEMRMYTIHEHALGFESSLNIINLRDSDIEWADVIHLNEMVFDEFGIKSNYIDDRNDFDGKKIFFSYQGTSLRRTLTKEINIMAEAFPAIHFIVPTPCLLEYLPEDRVTCVPQSVPIEDPRYAYRTPPPLMNGNVVIGHHAITTRDRGTGDFIAAFGNMQKVNLSIVHNLPHEISLSLMRQNHSLPSSFPYDIDRHGSFELV